MHQIFGFLLYPQLIMSTPRSIFDDRTHEIALCVISLNAFSDESARHLYAFAMVVVRRKKDGKFLLVQEFASEGFYLPGKSCDVNFNFDAFMLF